MKTLQELQRAEEERARAAKQNQKTGLYNAYKMGNQARTDIGQLGKQLGQYGQQYNNQGLQNVGNKLYKWSGEKYLDNGIQKIGDKVGKLWGDKVDTGINKLTDIANKGSNPIQTGSDIMNSGVDKLSTELTQQGAQQGLQQGGSALTNAIGTETAGAGTQAGGSALTGAIGSEVAGAGAGTAGAGAGSGALGSAIAAETGGTALAGGTTGLTAGAGTAATGAATGAASAGMAAVPIIGWAALAAKLAYDVYSSHKKKQQGAAMQADAQADAEMEQDQNQQLQEQANSEKQMQKFTDMINKQLGQGGTDNPYMQAIQKAQQEQQPNVDLDQWEGGDELNVDENSAAVPAPSTGQEVANAGADVATDLFSRYQGGEGANSIAGAISQEAPSDYAKVDYFDSTPHNPLTGEVATQEDIQRGQEELSSLAPQEDTDIEDYEEPEEDSQMNDEAIKQAMYDAYITQGQDNLIPFQKTILSTNGRGLNDRLSQNVLDENKMAQDIYNSYTNGGTSPQAEQQFVAPQTEGDKKAAARESIPASELGFLSNVRRGYDENVTHRAGDTRGENYLRPEERNWQTRLGEGLGTASRIAQNPAVQALLAGGIDYALTRDGKSAAKTALSIASDRGKTNTYRDLLQQGDNPVYYNPGLFGQITSNDYRTIMQQPLQNAHIEKYKQEALEKQLKNEATQLMNNMTPDTFSLAANMATSPRKAAELLSQYEQKNGALDETQRKIINTIMGKPELMKIFSDANKNTNAYNRNKISERQEDRKDVLMSKFGVPQVSKMIIERSGGGGGSGYGRGYGSSGGGSKSGSIVPLATGGKHPDLQSDFNGKTGIWDLEQGAYGWYDDVDKIKKARQRNAAYQKAQRERAEQEERLQSHVTMDDDKYMSKATPDNPMGIDFGNNKKKKK